MGEPEVNRDYFFVRRSGAAWEVVQFTRFEDGSATLFQTGHSPWSREDSPDAWKRAHDYLRESGHVELAEALRSGLLTEDQADELLA
jgi:hypothetical protein